MLDRWFCPFWNVRSCFSLRSGFVMLAYICSCVGVGAGRRSLGHSGLGLNTVIAIVTIVIVTNANVIHMSVNVIVNVIIMGWWVCGI